MALTTTKLGNVAFAGLLLLIGLFVLKSFFIATAPVPEMFSERLTLEQAIERSADKNHVVLAVFTADWCGPCQTYKKNGLTDERVAQWISEHGEPAYIDLDLNKELAAELGVTSVPATFFIYKGEALGAISGAMSGDNLLNFLSMGLEQATLMQASADDSE